MIKFRLENERTLCPSIELNQSGNMFYLTIDDVTILSVGLNGQVSLITANIEELFGDCKVIGYRIASLKEPSE